MTRDPTSHAGPCPPERANNPSRRGHKRPPRETSDRWLRCRLDDEQADRLRREAAGTDQTIASLARSIFEEHWALHEELAAPIGTIGDEKSGRIIHQLLAETEQRIAGSYEAGLRRVHKRLDALFERVEMLCVMVAQAYHGYLLHTPEVPLEHEEAFVASAADRYAGYEEMVARILARGGLELARRVEERRSSDSSEESLE